MSSDLSPPPRIIEEFTTEWKDWLWYLYDKVENPTTSATITSSDSPYGATAKIIFADASSGAITITLPTNLSNDTTYIVKKVDGSGNAVTLDGGTINIDGATTASITTQYAVLEVYWDQTQWWKV